MSVVIFSINRFLMMEQFIFFPQTEAEIEL